MKSYHFDPKTQSYTVYCKDGTDIVTSKEEHQSILIDYTVRKLPISRICLNNKMSASQFDEYRRAFNLTRDSIPLSDEEVLNNPDTQKLALELLERTNGVTEAARDLEFEFIKSKAEKWNQFESGVLKPFETALSKWKPQKSKLPASPKAKKNNRWFCVGFSDWQIGSSADPRQLFRQEEWNTKKAVGAINELVSKIKQDVDNDKVGYEGCVVIFGGDLLHGVKGETAKGTQLITDVTGEQQYDFLLDALYSVVESLSSVFNKVVIHTVKGNHEGVDHYPVMVALKNYFRKDKRIEFNIHSTRTATFKIANTMILLDHGSSDFYHNADIPKGGKPRESYIQSLMLAKADVYKESNGCIFLQGDKHHYEQIEFNDFEFIMLGALPLGDRYADNHNWHSRARQNCFVVDENGLKSVFHYYV